MYADFTVEHAEANSRGDNVTCKVNRTGVTTDIDYAKSCVFISKRRLLITFVSDTDLSPKDYTLWLFNLATPSFAPKFFEN